MNNNFMNEDSNIRKSFIVKEKERNNKNINDNKINSNNNIISCCYINMLFIIKN